MSKGWLDLLSLELESISPEEVIEPESEVDDERDRPAGTADDDLRRLYTKWQQLREVAERTGLDARYTRDVVAREAAIARALELFQKSEIVREIFWACVKDSFSLWGKDSVGVRKGWIVVWTEEEESGLPEMLKRLFGGPPV
ncbi:MAG: hypothetical protein HYW38_01505 [Candidatus Colwellbacteria bacterium]|nr:hypothetical protein [Candidatus Colwellbacteria bacterium]